MMYGLMPDMNVVAYAEDVKGLICNRDIVGQIKGQSEFICKVNVFKLTIEFMRTEYL